jgi:hypothetical protein
MYLQLQPLKDKYEHELGIISITSKNINFFYPN